MPDIFIDKESKEDKIPVKKTEATLKEPKKDENIDPAKSEDTTQLLHSLGIKSHGGRVHALSSYFEDPSKVKFTNILEDEILLLFLRRHFMTNLPWILKAFALCLIPVIFEFLGAFGFYTTDFIGTSGKFIVYFFYYFFILSGYVFVNYMTWFYNISLVTNLRIVDIDFSDVVFENVAATKLSQLEDVSYIQIGILRSIFDYGDVHVQTAGTNANFEFLAIPHPENVIRIINSLIGRKHHA